MKNFAKIVFVLAVAGAIAYAGWLYLEKSRETGGAPGAEAGQSAQAGSPRSGKTASQRTGKPGKAEVHPVGKHRVVSIELFEDGNFTPEEKKTLKAMQEALDDGGIEDVRKFAASVGRSPNPEVRLAYVEALDWFGAEALAEITPFMGDRDESVADAAAAAWQQALASIDDDAHKLEVAEEAMKIIDNPIVLDMLGAELTAIDDDVKMVSALVRVIQDGNKPASAKAKELYEDETGEEWTDIDAAEAWLAKKIAEDDESERAMEQTVLDNADAKAGIVREAPPPETAPVAEPAAEAAPEADAEGEVDVQEEAGISDEGEDSGEAEDPDETDEEPVLE